MKITEQTQTTRDNKLRISPNTVPQEENKTTPVSDEVILSNEKPEPEKITTPAKELDISKIDATIDTPIEAVISILTDPALALAIGKAMYDKKKLKINRTIYSSSTSKVEQNLLLEPVGGGLLSRKYKGTGACSDGQSIKAEIEGNASILSMSFKGTYKAEIGKNKVNLNATGNKEQTNIQGTVGNQKININLEGYEIKDSHIGNADYSLGIYSDPKGGLSMWGTLNDGNKIDIVGKIDQPDENTYKIKQNFGSLYIEEQAEIL